MRGNGHRRQEAEDLLGDLDVLEGLRERGGSARGNELRHRESGSISKAAHVAPNATMAHACPRSGASMGLEPTWLRNLYRQHLKLTW